MGKGYELEKRVLAMISKQFEGIYQINMDDKSATCVYDVKNELGEENVLSLDDWLHMLLDDCYFEDREELEKLLSEDALSQCIKGKRESNELHSLRKDIRFRNGEGCKWICITLMAEIECNQITITFRDVTHRYKYDEIIQRKNAELIQLLQTTEQYRDALLTESVVLYQVNFTKDRIESDLFQKNTTEDGVVKVLDTVDIASPGSYNEYCKRWQSRVSEDTIEEYRKFANSAYMVQAFREGHTLLNQDYRTLDSFGVEMWINKTIYLAQDKMNGDIVGIVSLRDVTDRYRQEYLRESLEKQASLDLLTGLYNHVTGEILIKNKIDTEKYMDTAFVIFDIDCFKNVNDTRGHYFGDCVLQKVAQILKSCIREDQDIAARYGGDEFVVFVTYRQEEDIFEIVDRIFRSVSCEYESYAISVSMGICLSGGNHYSYYELYKKADKALYRAKEEGKGRYIFAE